MKTLRSNSYSARGLGWLARAVYKYPRVFFYPQAILFLVSVLYTVRHLEFDTSRSNLVGAKKKYHQIFQQFKKEFPTQDDLVVVVESEDREKNRQLVERLGVKLEVETNLFMHVFYKGDLKMMGSKALLFVPVEDLVELRKTLGDYRPFLEQFAQTTNLISLFDMINTQFRTAKREANAKNESLVAALPALERIVSQAIAGFQRLGGPPSPGVMALFNAGEEAERASYITFDKGRIYLVTAQARTKEQNGQAVARLRQLVEETRAEVAGVNVGVTGEPVLEIDEMAQSERDTLLASVVSFGFIFVIIIYGYGNISRRLKADLCLLVGMAYTMAFTTLVIGHLNILTITFAPILIGVAIDFGVHLIARYEEELRRGRSEVEAMTTAMVFTGHGILTSAFTTAGAFLAMGFTDFKGIQEMGIICGGGLLICLVPMMTLLPVLLLLGRQNVPDHRMGIVVDHRERIENLWLRRPVAVMVLTVGLCALAVSQLHKIYFDYNLLNMQSKGLPAVEFEERLINSLTNATSGTNVTGRSVLFAAVIADSVESAVKLEERVRKLPAVAEVDSIAQFLQENPTEKLRLIGEIKAELADLIFKSPDPKPVNIAELSRTLYSTSGYLGLAAEAAENREPALARQMVSLRKAIEQLRVELWRGTVSDQEMRAKKLAAFQIALFTDLRETFDALGNQDNRGRLKIEDLPGALRDRFVGVSGKHLLQVYPKKNVWQRVNQEEFISQLRTIDPNVTGTPVQLYEYTTLLKKSYEQAAVYSLIAIAVLVFIHFRSVGSVILALLPVAIGSIWLGGAMGFFGIPFNPANIMTLPLVIGVGVTNGIHILNRFAEERTPSILAKSTGKAVLVSGLTTIAGFGSLALAKHQGIESLGYVMAMGTATCMIAGLTFLPALLNLLPRRDPKIKQPSADNARSTLGREEPR
jgi:hopanoid biosynthesis associated RND transporter like protein HpnN